MKRCALWLVMAMTLLAAGPGGLRAQDPEQPPGEPEEIPIDFENAGFSAPGDSGNQDWQGELDLIADLLIEGKAAEAKSRAEDLLEVKNISEDVAARARTLREKADARLAEPPAEPEARPRIEIPATSAEDKKTASAEKESQPQSFRIRVAVIGGGFGEGTSGLLRVTGTGLSFVRQGQTREDWSIPWKSLAEARSDNGLWDAPYPLVLVERGGRKRYIAHIDPKGRYLPGQSLLSAISKGRGR